MTNRPGRQGLYDPCYEKDGCGIGAVVHLKGLRSHALVAQSLLVLRNLNHRGATGYDANTGDGAGLIIQLPHHFLQAEMAAQDVTLPPPGSYAVGMVLLPKEAAFAIVALLKVQCQRLGFVWLGERRVPVQQEHIGAAAAALEPAIVQVFVAPPQGTPPLEFARRLYLARRLVQAEVTSRIELRDYASQLHFCSFSPHTIVYKGMLLPEQLPLYFSDLADPRLTSAIAVVHSRFSTNTFPAWKLAHPFHYLSHNGEINTIRGNLHWMKAREQDLAAALFGEDAAQTLPLISGDQSDSACLDDAVELLLLTGRSLAEAIMLLVPEAWQKNAELDDQRRAYAEYHATLMEPWDGPAALCFTDGKVVGVALDRSGLRPCRYTVTHQDLVILSSETGVLPVAAQDLKVLGKLRPGDMLLIDTERGELLDNELLKEQIAKKHDLQPWLDRHLISLSERRRTPHTDAAPSPLSPLSRQQTAFGLTREAIEMTLTVMAKTGEEPVNSMGDDTPLAVLSASARPLFDYFKQQFAQVTNPPLDPLREDLAMSLTMYLGAKGSLAGPPKVASPLVRIDHPILREGDLNALRTITALKTCEVSLLVPVAAGTEAFAAALTALQRQAADAALAGATLLILTDRGIDHRQAAIPSLLAVATVHSHLIQLGLRQRTDLVVVTGEAYTPHHIACLLGYGAAAVLPYLAFASIAKLHANGAFEPRQSADDAAQSYIKACVKGLSKILSKMGIATLQSYSGAQIFEAIGLSQELMAAHFSGTSSRLGGITAAMLASETLTRHAQAYDANTPEADLPPVGGFVHYRVQGEKHAWSPETIALLQQASQTGNSQTYQEYSRSANTEQSWPTALRHLLTLRPDATGVALDEVESAAAIVRRFTTGAMSLGAISKESHEVLAIAMNRMQAKSNTGEGGEDPLRFLPSPSGDSRNSAIKQIASGRFGVTAHYLVNAEEIQIKIAQGAKPGEGGQLPGHKVDLEIARLRHSTPGVQLISPPPHHDIYSIEDLAQLIYDLKNVNPAARISVKLVAQSGIGAVAVGVAKAGAHKILVSGDGGGTGAAALSSIKHAGTPWEMGLAEVHQTLLLNRLRDRVILETDGQLRTGRDVVIAALLGADEFGFSTAPLVVQGCIMMRKCHLNTCPVGIATQDPELRSKFSGTPEHVINFFFFVAEEVRQLLAQLGLRHLGASVGRSDLLEQRVIPGQAKANALDLSPLLHRPSVASGQPAPFVPFTPTPYDAAILAKCMPALEHGMPVVLSQPITNVCRATGALLSGEIVRRHGAAGLPSDSISLNFTGSAGQSFGAFLAAGIRLHLAGAANDYVGKGLSGGQIAIVPPRGAAFATREPVLIGNTTLYGATSGSLFVAGTAGERFAVRNSGASAVVEGVGDHGCEYMTGGVVVVLGSIGRNFAAGMSGGTAFIFDPHGSSHRRCNLGMVDLTTLRRDTSDVDLMLLRQLLMRHAELTASVNALALLKSWDANVQHFIRIVPKQERKATHPPTLRVPNARFGRSEVPTHA